MIRKSLEELKKTPEILKSAEAAFRSAPVTFNAKKKALQENLESQRQELKSHSEALIELAKAQVESAKSQLDSAKSTGQKRLWNFETNALEAVEAFLGKADETVIAKWANALEDRVTERLETVTFPAIENYDALNAKAVIKSLNGLTWLELLKVARHEQLTKDRKTVLKAVGSALQTLQN
jgi:chromosome segregation ATPase